MVDEAPDAASRRLTDIRRLLVEPWPARPRDILAASIALIAFTIGAIAFVVGRVDAGLTLAQQADGRVVVASVRPGSPFAGWGIQGDVVVSLNDWILVAMPHDKGVVPVTGEALERLLQEPIGSLAVVNASELDRYLASPSTYDEIYASLAATPTYALQQTDVAMLLGLAIVFVGGWWLASGRGGPTLRPLAIPIVVATATPLFLAPLVATYAPFAIAVVAILWPMGSLPLADGLSGLVVDPIRRGRVRVDFLILALLSGAIVAVNMVVFGNGVPLAIAQWIVIGLVTIDPGLAAGRRNGSPTAVASSGRVVEGLEVMAAAATPLVAGFVLVPRGDPAWVWPLLLWIAILLIGQRFTVRPLARAATRATIQRDLVVAATEAERARIAADLHDETLQDLTLLVHQLEARGDADGAEAGRRIAERVRTLTGELRLPVLDDLGVGPSLEWLVGRIERLAGGEVRLERDDGSRLPPDIELAFFRVAQEALANAVKHGRPPIIVRYRAVAAGATLTIDDAGPGIPPDATEAATAAGHFGLLGMQQRAEQIGALLDVRRWPGGGTHVGLEWRAP